MGKAVVNGTEISQQINFLKNIPFFSDFDDHELTQFLAVSKWLKVPKKTLIIKEDAVEKVFYILVKGEVSVFKTLSKEDDILELTTLSTGDCFGEMAMVTETRRTAGVMTTKESFILKVDPEIINTSNVFLQLKFYKRFCEIMVSRLDMANRRMAGQKMPEPEIALEPEEKPKPVPVVKARTVVVEKPREPRPVVSVKLPPDELPLMPEKKERLSKVILRKRIEPDHLMAVNPALVKLIGPFLSGDCTNTRQFTDLLYLDPVLSSRVLKIANSSLYRRSCVISSVPHAIISVGINVVQEVVEEAIKNGAGIPLFGRIPELAHNFWQHSVAVGRVAEILKDIIRINISSDVYLAGLLHDLGMLVLDPVEPGFYPQLQRQDHGFENLIKAEIEFVGVDHGTAGGWLGEKTGLPTPYLDVMRFHHEPEKATDNILLVSVVHLANIFVARKGCCVGGQNLRTIDPLTSPAWTLLRREHRPFSEVDIGDFIQRFVEEIDKAWDEIISSVPL
ncbi:MAG: HDOD domain-containing protein [Proteobacteria bacterium]|nr:HDOD domain-containing protein [Pseudomonadota bacterium]MBU1714190.1 HDOD domain-containing protein [Pseudomonadota bacterium]